MATTTKNSAKLTFPAENQILVVREFAAHKRLVYRAYTECELVNRWWHGDHGEMKSCEIDLRVGGGYRFAMTAGDGFEVAFRGEYKELVPFDRIVATETYEGAPEAGPALNTLTLEERDGRTTMTILMEYPNRQVRDMVVQSGMESGLQKGLDLLEELAISAA